MDQHFLSSYYDAMLSVILAQFTAKGFADGTDGIIRLAESCEFIAVRSWLTHCIGQLWSCTLKRCAPLPELS